MGSSRPNLWSKTTTRDITHPIQAGEPICQVQTKERQVQVQTVFTVSCDVFIIWYYHDQMGSSIKSVFHFKLGTRIESWDKQLCIDGFILVMIMYAAVVCSSQYKVSRTLMLKNVTFIQLGHSVAQLSLSYCNRCKIFVETSWLSNMTEPQSV